MQGNDPPAKQDDQPAADAQLRLGDGQEQQVSLNYTVQSVEV